MGQIRNGLTARKVKAINKPGLYGDGGTLFLRVAPGGSKQWMQRLTINGKRRDIGLGSVELVTLAEAREAAFENRKLARRGGDPLAERRKANSPTFREANEKVLDTNRKRWRSDVTARNWQQSVEKYAYPVIGDTRLDRIQSDHVLRILTPIWTDKPEVSRKLRQRLTTVFQWAIAHKHMQVNPAGEAIDGALPRMPAVKAHFRSLPYQDIAGALRTVEDSRASLAAKYAIRFLVLTAARSGEVREASWSEVDGRVWKIPGERMKQGTEHRVPLSGAAMAVLEQARRLDDGSGLIFPSPMRVGRPLSNMSLTKLLRDNGLADRATVHGFRSSFRDWCADTGKPREIAEAALAHTVGGVEGAYFRSDLFERRRRLMDQWAAFLVGESARVVSIHG